MRITVKLDNLKNVSEVVLNMFISKKKLFFIATSMPKVYKKKLYLVER